MYTMNLLYNNNMKEKKKENNHKKDWRKMHTYISKFSLISIDRNHESTMQTLTGMDIFIFPLFLLFGKFNRVAEKAIHLFLLNILQKYFSIIK